MELFTPLARLFAANALVPRLVAWRAANRAAVVRLVASTGSRLEPRGVELYARLVRNAAHVGAALDMMAGWDLAPLERDLPTLRTPLSLIVGSGDKAVPVDEARRVCERVPGATLRILPGSATSRTRRIRARWPGRSRGRRRTLSGAAAPSRHACGGHARAHCGDSGYRRVVALLDCRGHERWRAHTDHAGCFHDRSRPRRRSRMRS